jgi:DNA-directed RNA polymerase subunit RPC12/RpoP
MDTCDAVDRNLVKKDISRWRGYIDDDMIARMHITIDKLPPATPQSCEDAISRQAVLDAFWKLDVEIRPSAIDAITKMINDISPVTPQQKVGRWIPIENEDMEIIGYFCSNCDLPMETEEKTVYCPNCGSKNLKGEKKDVVLDSR